MAQEREYADDQQEHRTNVFPTESPEDPRTFAQHLLDVVREIVHAVEPEDTRRFDEDDEQDRQSRAIDIQELDQIDTTLSQ